MNQLKMSSKIIFLFTPGPMGGAEKIVIGGFEALRKLGLDVELWIISEERVPQVTKEFTAVLDLKNLNYKLFSCRSILDFKLIKKLKEELAKNQNIMIHAHGFKAAFYGQITKRKNQKLIITHHGKTAHTLKVRIYEMIEDFIMKKSNQVIAVSHPMKEKLVDAKIPENKITVIENFLTIDPTPPSISKPTSIIKVIFIGRLSPEKGCHILIDTFNQLTSKNFTLTIVGDGVDKGMLELANNNPHVEFLGFRKDISQLLGGHDLLVMPSYREGLPLALIEACCIGLPVLASNVGGIPDLIDHGKNGYLVAPGSSEELKNGFEYIQNNIDSLRKVSTERRENFQARFSLQSWANSTIEVYRSLLSQP